MWQQGGHWGTGTLFFFVPPASSLGPRNQQVHWRSKTRFGVVSSENRTWRVTLTNYGPSHCLKSPRPSNEGPTPEFGHVMLKTLGGNVATKGQFVILISKKNLPIRVFAMAFHGHKSRCNFHNPAQYSNMKETTSCCPWQPPGFSVDRLSGCPQTVRHCHP